MLQTNTLYTKFGYCVIPKGTKLYRGYSDSFPKEKMFFTTKFIHANAFNRNIQVWKANKDIRVLFLIDHLDYLSLGKSSVLALYEILFPNFEKLLDCVTLKNNHELMIKFSSSLLREYNVSGWLSSLEDNCPLEVCLFGIDENQDQLNLLNETTIEDKSKYYYDSLYRIKVFPTNEFFCKTRKKLQNHYGALLTNWQIFSHYKSFKNENIKHEASSSNNKKELIHREFNLRLKLKI